MARWLPDAAGRLQRAALALFDEHGFAAVTVQEIATHAGVTERTFFRHFATKEDVLFGDGPELLAAIVGAVRSAPEGASPNRVMQAVAECLGALFEVERPHHRQRVRVLAADPALLERDLLKQVAWAQTIGSELVARGLPAGRAVVLASAATATFRTVYVAWATDRSRTKLADRLRMALADLSADLAMTE